MGELTKGSILIVTLWTLSFLTTFAVGLARNASGQLRLASHLQDRSKMYYLAAAGIERGIIELKADETPKYDSLNERWSNSEELFKEIPLDEGYITLSYRMEEEGEDSGEAQEIILYGLMDESSRISINKAPLEVLESMLENIGEVEQDAAADIANAIVDWRDIDIIVSPGGAENAYYESLELPYPCKSGDFQMPQELLLVKGMTPGIFSKIAGVITLYGEGKVNINTAGWRVLHALGLSSELAQRVVQFRRGKDGIDGTEDDIIFNTAGEIRNIGPLFTKEAGEINRLTSLNALAVKSDVFRINSAGILKKGGRKLQKDIVCVVSRSAKKPAQILYWRED
ncbi:MAG: general secretion pathway protein GspK [Candidatus Omnitrophica bacterium]|nr:general secretion pathway protein GspK [Candidatus Omnitrophota bacterium]